MNLIPVVLATGIAATASVYILQNHQQDLAKVNHQAVVQGFENIVGNLSPTSEHALCNSLNASFANNLPDGSTWKVAVKKVGGKCDHAELKITLPNGINPMTVFPTATNIALTGQTITWSLNLVAPLALQTPYQTRLLGAQTDSQSECAPTICSNNN